MKAAITDFVNHTLTKTEGHKNAWRIAAKILLILLTVVVFISLLYLIAAWSCNLSCNGQDTAAALVIIGGLALDIWFLVACIRAIVRCKKKAPPVER